MWSQGGGLIDECYLHVGSGELEESQLRMSYSRVSGCRASGDSSTDSEADADLRSESIGRSWPSARRSARQSLRELLTTSTSNAANSLTAIGRRLLSMKGKAMGLGDAQGDWYYCFKHNRVETSRECHRMDRMGPYATQEDAEHWRERVAARNKEWEDEEE